MLTTTIINTIYNVCKNKNKLKEADSDKIVFVFIFISSVVYYNNASLITAFPL